LFPQIVQTPFWFNPPHDPDSGSLLKIIPIDIAITANINKNIPIIIFIYFEKFSVKSRLNFDLMKDFINYNS
tara:strand:+ start:1369 stop:1584 length:216 start_codon:yes stop_codon:yes gene_type:complete